MNIKEHIEAGHYPKDDKGRALVPTRDGRTFCVLLTDLEGQRPIGGYCTDSFILGSQYADSTYLLPPPPRKRTVKAWVTVGPTGQTACLYHHPVAVKDGCQCVELTGEYEEPWS